MWAQLNRLFSVPKGFGKFYPKGATKVSNKKGPGFGGGSGGGGPGGTGGKPELPDNAKIPILIGTVGLGYFLLSSTRNDPRRFGK